MKSVNSRKSRLAKLSVSIAAALLLNTNGLCAPPSSAAQPNLKPAGRFVNNPTSLTPKVATPLIYGLDPDRVLFALKTDGTKARYLSLCATHVKLQIVKGVSIGEVEYSRVSPTETLTTFAPAGGNKLLVRSTATPQRLRSKDDPGLNLIFQLKGDQAVLNSDASPNQRGAGGDRKLEALVQDARANQTLTTLLTESGDFLNAASLAGLFPCLHRLNRRTDYSVPRNFGSHVRGRHPRAPDLGSGCGS